MRDRARAKSAESALMHVHSSIAAVLETAQRNQEQMISNVTERSSTKLARIQVRCLETTCPCCTRLGMC